MNAIVGTWVMDPAQSEVRFSVRYLAKTVEGWFGQFSGEAHVEEDITKSTVSGTVDVTTINTGDEERDKRIRSSEFFNVEKFPTITFQTHSWNTSEADDEITLEGELTIAGVTHPATFKGTFGDVEVRPEEVDTASLKLVTKISRDDFGLKWDSAADTGGLVLGDEVTVTVTAKAHRKEAEPAVLPVGPESPTF